MSRSGSRGDFRRLVLLLETAAVLESRAARSTDHVQAATLRRRAEQRLREAESIRQGLGGAGPSSARPRAWGASSSPGRRNH